MRPERPELRLASPRGALSTRLLAGPPGRPGESRPLCRGSDDEAPEVPQPARARWRLERQLPPS